MEDQKILTRYRYQSTTASLTEQNTFSEAVRLLGRFNFSLAGTWAGTVFVQRSFDAGMTWRDVNSYTANIEDGGNEAEIGVIYRAGFKTGGYTSGTADVRLSQ